MLFALSILALGACSRTDSNAAPPGGDYARLPRQTHPLARPENDLGRLDPTTRLHHLSLVFAPTPAQRTERDALLAELERPGSPRYHQWITPEAYAERFGARAGDVARATTWLEAQGLTVHAPSRLGARVTFSGTVAQVESAFRAEMHRYAALGQTHRAWASEPSLPADLAARTLALYNTHDFYPSHGRQELRVAQPDATCPAGGHCSGNGIAPPDWTTIYDVGPVYTGVKGSPITGAGVTIAVVGIAAIAQADLDAFRARYGLAASTITMTLVPDTGIAQAANGAGLEAVLDTEWAGAIAPSASINYVYTGANDANVADAAYYAIEQSYGAVLSESWGGCEQGAQPSDTDVLEVYGTAANLLGITYVASTGDSGAAGCGGENGLYVSMPASFPGVTAVGGTGFSKTGGLTFTSGAVTARGTEAVWNEHDDRYMGSVAAGGGGISAVFARPAYQASVATCTPVGTLPTGVDATKQRQVPDIAFTAGSGVSQYGIFIECTLSGTDCTDTGAAPLVMQIGGTSASTPAFAGIVALAAQATGGRLGNINPVLYALERSTPSAFHDIATGNNEVVCQTGDPGCPGNNQLYGYPATTGYDCASGLGSLDAASFVDMLVTLAPTTTTLGASPSATTEGGAVTLAATVGASGTSSAVVGGTMTFGARTYFANGAVGLSWSLGEVAITDGTTTSGSATLTTAVPPGMIEPTQTVDVYANYSGDANHLSSLSSNQSITFSDVYLCIDPPTSSVAAGGKVVYAASGGVAPVRLGIAFDSTCSTPGVGCSRFGAGSQLTAGTGEPGYVIVVATDADGAETYSEVTVAGGAGTVPWTDGPPDYAGIVVSRTRATACAVEDCGSVPDGCGGRLACGTCRSPQSCGGGGVANRCGCPSSPLATVCANQCGTVTDGCGVARSCDTTYCPSAPHTTATCSGNTCGLACASGFHSCSGTCVSDASAMSCGSSSCSACPTPSDPCMAAACVSGACGAAPIDGCASGLDMAPGRALDMSASDLATAANGSSADASTRGSSKHSGCDFGAGTSGPSASLCALFVLVLVLRSQPRRIAVRAATSD